MNEQAHEPRFRSADFQSAVSRLFNPQVVGPFHACRIPPRSAEFNSAIQQIANLRYETTACSPNF